MTTKKNSVIILPRNSEYIDPHLSCTLEEDERLVSVFTLQEVCPPQNIKMYAVQHMLNKLEEMREALKGRELLTLQVKIPKSGNWVLRYPSFGAEQVIEGLFSSYLVVAYKEKLEPESLKKIQRVEQVINKCVLKAKTALQLDKETFNALYDHVSVIDTTTEAGMGGLWGVIHETRIYN